MITWRLFSICLEGDRISVDFYFVKKYFQVQGQAGQLSKTRHCPKIITAATIKGYGYSFVIESLLSLCENLGSILNVEKRKEKGKREERRIIELFECSTFTNKIYLYENSLILINHQWIKKHHIFWVLVLTFYVYMWLSDQVN